MNNNYLTNATPQTRYQKMLYLQSRIDKLQSLYQREATLLQKLVLQLDLLVRYPDKELDIQDYEDHFIRWINSTREPLHCFNHIIMPAEAFYKCCPATYEEELKTFAIEKFNFNNTTSPQYVQLVQDIEEFTKEVNELKSSLDDDISELKNLESITNHLQVIGE